MPQFRGREEWRVVGRSYGLDMSPDEIDLVEPGCVRLWQNKRQGNGQKKRSKYMEKEKYPQTPENPPLHRGLD